MRPFVEYVSTLRKLVAQQASPSATHSGELLSALDGQPGRELRRLVSLAERRADGVFFTGSSLASETVSHYLADVTPNHVVCDPACGAGDLLIAASRLLPVRDDLRETLGVWGVCLRGFDIHPEFIEATQLRLALAAISRGARTRNA